MKGNRLHTSEVFLLTPLREGRLKKFLHQLEAQCDFYSRPCGRGDAHGRTYGSFRQISTHAPAGGATPPLPGGPTTYSFLLTPLREGRPVL